jgi:hypothetical protein
MHEEFFLWAQALVISLSSMPLALHDLPTHKHFFHNLILGHVGEYSLVACTLAPYFPTLMSSNTTLVLITLHFELDRFPPFFGRLEVNQNQDLELSFDSFKLTFQCMLNLFANGPSRMVFKHL